MSDTTNIANLAMVANDLKTQIDRFIEGTKCDSEDVIAEESDMYVYLQKASDYIEDYLTTQQMDNRKFEVGKAYYDKYYELKVVEKLTPNGLWFKGAYGASRVKEWLDGNEIVDGVYQVKA